MSLTVKIAIFTIAYLILLVFAVSAEHDVKNLEEFFNLPGKPKFEFTVLKYGIMFLFWYVYFIIKAVRKSRNIQSL